jgi:hypothetical protein
LKAVGKEGVVVGWVLTTIILDTWEAKIRRFEASLGK